MFAFDHRLLRTYARCGESPPETADKALPKSTVLRKCSTTVAAYVRLLHRRFRKTNAMLTITRYSQTKANARYCQTIARYRHTRAK